MEQNLTLNKGMPFYIAPEIATQLLKGKKKVLDSDQDRIYVVTGREGLGKSTLAIQLAYLIYPDLKLSNIVYTPKQFEEKIRSANKHEAIIYDEGFSGLSSKGSISKENKRLVRLLMECRQRNLFIFICLPSFFLLEKYVALFRATALFNVLCSRKNFKLRYYKVYNYSQKRVLYLLGKGLMDYSRPKIHKSYRFYGKLPPNINAEDYKQRKLEAFRNQESDEKEETRPIRQRNLLGSLLNKEFGVSYSKIADYLTKNGEPITLSVICRQIKATPPKVTL